MGEKKSDHLDTWMVHIRDAVVARGVTAVLGYDDRLLGDVMVLSFPDAALCEVVVTRAQRHRARVAAVAESQAAAARAAAALAGLHHDVPRLRNAMRKFVHRVERVVEHLAAEYDRRSAGFPAEALARVQPLLAEARPMTGVGYHTNLAGSPERRGKRRRGEHYESVYAIAVPVAGVRRSQPWDPAQGAFVASAVLLTSLAAGTDLAAHGLSGARTATTGGEIGAAAPGATDGEPGGDPNERSNDDSWCDCTDSCDVIDCGFDLGSLVDGVSSCVPDCDGIDVPDCGGCDVGGCDL